MKKVLLAAAFAATVGFTAEPAAAQGMSEWGMWDGPRTARRPPAVARPAYDADDEYFERRDLPSSRARRDDRGWQNEPDWEDGDQDDNDDDRQYQRRDAQPQYENPNEEQYDEQANGATQSPRGPDGKPIGQDGGPQPFVKPIAPEIVSFGAGYAPGSIVIDTGARKLYFVRDVMSAFAYPIGVGRDGFSWNGTEKVSRIADWPDWYPPAEMRKRKPELPERMLGGLNNPLGAKAIYLGNTLYRIHGTNDPKSIGRAESSGCFRMLNGHVLHLASLVQVGAEVTVVPSLSGAKVSASNAAPARQAQSKPLTVRPRNARVQWSADIDDGGYDDEPYVGRY